MLFLIVSGFACIYQFNKYTVTIIFCFLTAASIFVRIQYLQYKFQQDNNFLEKPLIVRGTVEQLQHNTQDRAVTTILVQTDTILSKDVGTLDRPKTISIQIPYKRSQKLELGQLVVFHNICLEQPPPTINIQDNPYFLYLIKEGIWASAYISSEKFFIISCSKAHWYQQVLQYLSHHFNAATGHLYNPLFLGKKEKDSLSLHIQHQSLYWGIAHHMARSGIHLVTLVGLCIAIFHYLQLRSRFRFGLYALLITGYALITISSISFIRSMIMIIIQMFSKLNGFQYSGIHAFALTTLIVVQHNPFHVLFLDFQLSFGITAVIIWLFYVKWAKTVAFPIPSFIRC